MSNIHTHGRGGGGNIVDDSQAVPPPYHEPVADNNGPGHHGRGGLGNMNASDVAPRPASPMVSDHNAAISHGRGGAGNITETHPKEHHHHGLGDLIHLPIHKDAHKQANGGERPIPVGEAQPGPQPKVQGGEFIRTGRGGAGNYGKSPERSEDGTRSRSPHSPERDHPTGRTYRGRGGIGNAIRIEDVPKPTKSPPPSLEGDHPSGKRHGGRGGVGNVQILK